MTSSTSTEIDDRQPAEEVYEISIFGPGVGECIVLHLGTGKWFIVDSCLSPNTKRPIALDYLQRLGVSASDSVEGILITHWHKDHTAGLPELVAECHSAKIFLSAALTSLEGLSFLRLFSKDRFSPTDREVRDLAQTLQFLRESNGRSRWQPITARYLFRDGTRNQSGKLISLSPSSVAVSQAIAKLASYAPEAKEPRLRRIVPDGPNFNAVALHFTGGKHCALLGSDLEECGKADTGWSALLLDNIYSELGLGVATMFKVPHHGSATSHHDGIWSDLLAEKPLSFTTPYSRSRLPSPSDISRITLRSDALWVTRHPAAGRKVNRDRMVEREMDAVVKSRRSVNDKMGHLQIRFCDSDGVAVCNNGLPVRYTAAEESTVAE